jgi:hypothetical protein
MSVLWLIESTLINSAFTIQFLYDTVYIGQTAEITLRAPYATGVVTIDIVNTTTHEYVGTLTPTPVTLPGGPNPFDYPWIVAASNIPEGGPYDIRITINTSTILLVSYSSDNFTLTHIELQASFVTDPGNELFVTPGASVIP